MMLEIEIVPGSVSSHTPGFGREIPAEDEQRIPAPRKSVLKVLVVDDEQLIADTLAQILKRDGFDAMVAYGGKQALQIAARFRPDCLLADVLMPFMNGVELAIAVRKMSANTRILLFSGHAESSDLLDEARMKGHKFDVVAKPIHPEKLMRLLRNNR
jgi:DNA-binding response OmpR family regulator